MQEFRPINISVQVFRWRKKFVR